MNPGFQEKCSFIVLDVYSLNVQICFGISSNIISRKEVHYHTITCQILVKRDIYTSENLVEEIKTIAYSGR
ncbi:hypothetical protein L2E82_10809 [Cichorium intybus]|uniref:Uncharacterized protein n=1 Tax=Cichorium intybus TaxID=13427 RepID=A0ACB9GBG1_CICIN|nr:hypothetical protein L2E82_10809 [Cichorium intybus]